VCQDFWEGGGKVKTYWDFTEQERAEMTAETVTALLDVELMEKGVRKPKPPELKLVPESPLGPRKKFYTLSGNGKYGTDVTFDLAFPTIEQAQKFMELSPVNRDYDYEVGTEFHYAKPVGEMSIGVEELYTIDQVNEFRSALKNRKAAMEHNQKAQSAYNEAASKSEKVTQGVLTK
jgi:hypothetical protein